MKKIVLLLFLMITLALVGCQTTPEPKSISFSQETLTIEIGYLDILPFELENISMMDLDFSLSNEDIVEIENNIVYAMAIGSTVLTVTYRNDATIQASITIEITPVLPRLYASRTHMAVGQTIKIEILNFTNYDEFIWTIDDESILSLNNVYITQGLNIGIATITVTHKDYPEITSSIEIEVLPQTPTLIAYTNLIQVNDVIQMSIENLGELTESDFTWTLSDSEVVSLDASYRITGMREGTTTLTIVYKFNPLVTSSYEITVGAPTTGGPLFITAENITGVVQAGEQLDITIVNSTSNYNYRWLSSDATLVGVTDNGVVHGIKEGRAVIYAISMTNPSIRGQINVTVEGTPNVDYISRMISVANNEIGYMEGYNNANKYGVWFEYPNVAWCAIFVSWVANQAGVGIDVVPKFSSVSHGMLWYQQRDLFEFKEDYTPKAGDIIFFKSDGASHTGIVTGCDGEIVYTTEGNTSNGVFARSYPLDYRTITGYGLPDYPPFND